jgi:hypothetical protein
VITFNACSSTAYSSGACSSTNPYLQVVVTYGDYSSQQLQAGITCSITCGNTMAINSWVFEDTSI